MKHESTNEPVATLWQHGETGRTRITTPDSITDCDASWFKVSDLYTHPQDKKKDEALRLGLEVLKINLVFLRNVKPFKGQEDLASDCISMTDEAITLIEQALENK